MDSHSGTTALDMTSPRSPGGSLYDSVQAAVQHVYKLPKSQKRRYCVSSLDARRESYTMEDVISPKSSQAHLLHALDYFRHAELANGRLAEFQKERSRKAIEAKLKAGQVRRSKSLENLSALDKFRKATEKIKIVNTIRHPGLAAGMGKAELGKANDLQARLLKKRSVSEEL